MEIKTLVILDVVPHARIENVEIEPVPERTVILVRTERT